MRAALASTYEQDEGPDVVHGPRSAPERNHSAHAVQDQEAEQMQWRDERAGCHAVADITTTAPAGAIDLDHLSRYTLGNQALQKEVLALFRARSQIYIQRLEEAPDAKAWANAAHTLKGSARTIGAMDIARHAAAAERLSDDLESADHRTALQELNQLVAKANRSIDAMLGDTATDAQT